MSGRAEPRLPPTEDNPEGDSAPGFTRQAAAYGPTRWPSARRAVGAVRRAALPLRLQLSRRRERPGGVGRGGRPARPGRTGHDRPRRALRGARFAEAAEAYELTTVYGAELSLGLTTPQNGVADPEGQPPAGAGRGVEGYHRLAGAITAAQLRGDEKGRPLYDLEELAEPRRRALDDPDRLPQGPASGRPWQHRAGRSRGRELDRLVALFGPDRVVVELIDHGLPTDSTSQRRAGG